MKIYKIDNINIHSFSKSELEEEFIRLLTNPGKPQLVTTFNLDFLRITERNKVFLQICKKSLWNLPDGIGITSLLKLIYSKKVSRITGNDIFPLILKTSAIHNLKTALIGSEERVLVKVKEKVENEYYGLSERMLFIAPGYLFEYDEAQNESIISKLNDFEPDIVLCALGCPRQEIWLENNMNLFGSKLNIGVGSVFDNYSGVKNRSPVLLQKLGLEWLWRLFNEPVRLFKRYVILDVPFYIKKLYDILKIRLSL